MASGRITAPRLELERPLGREDAREAGVALRRQVHGAGQRLEGRLDDVVRVAARGHADVQVHRRLIGEREQEVVNQLDVEAADLRLLDLDVVDEERPSGEVDDARHQRLVERYRGLAEAADAGLVAERLAERLAERQADVLDRVVIVHLEVARRAHGEVEEAVAGEDLEHVVQERDTALHLVAPGSVEVQLQVDVGLLGASRDRGGPLVRARRGAAGAKGHRLPPLTAAARRAPARPSASRPSSRASRTTGGPRVASVRGPAPMTLVRLTKS